MTLSKSRRILREGCRLYEKRGATLSDGDRAYFEKELAALDESALKKDREEAALHAAKVDSFIKSHFPKTLLQKSVDVISALIFAVIFAFLIRELWFELYEVPTGSMRPTIEEKDRLVVSKTRFGLHLPFSDNLILFKPEYLHRAETVVFTVKDMDVADSDALYFYIFPGKKRFVKRCLGKPGDTVYFYGGQIYGIDREGKPITELADAQFLERIGIEKIDHVPTITFEGNVKTQGAIARGIYNEAIFSQMGKPVASLKFSEKEKGVEGRFFNGQEWVKENLAALKRPHSAPQGYSDLWGIGNYAQARLLSSREVENFYPSSNLKKGEAELYLELHHTPNLTYPEPILRQGENGKVFPSLSTQVALIPLKKTHLEAIQKALYTARFCVRKGRAFRYHEAGVQGQVYELDVRMPGVADGCYEFYYGKGYSVQPFGILKELAADHPLYDSSSENIKKLFNLGIAFNTLFGPLAPDQPYLPQRFAYFREGDLFLMGAPIIKKEDPTLQAFVKSEREKEQSSSEKAPYIAFIDRGAPLKEGKIDVDFIRAFGLPIPDDSLLALGDNYAMSADSREFGLVPVRNLRGSPSFIFWPPSKRIGSLPQPASPWFTLPNLIIWLLVLIIAIAWFLYVHERNKKAHFKKLSR